MNVYDLSKLLCLLLSVLLLLACNDNSNSNDKKKQVEKYLSEHIQFSTPKQVAQTANYYFTIYREKKINVTELPLYKLSPQYATSNIVFISKDWKIHRVLFDHQAFIHQIDIPTDSIQRNYIAYIAAIKDTNQDELVDEKDDVHLFVSDLNGENLTKVSPEDIVLLGFEHFQKNKEILIRYKEKTPPVPKNKIEFPKHDKLGVFYVESKYFMPIKGLDSTLSKIQYTRKALPQD